MPSTRSTLAASVAAGLIATVATPAALAAPGPAPQATDLDQVVVTATRTATTVEQALAPVEVLGRDAIERSQARSLHDLLRGRAGISLSRQGGPGKLATLFMRGAESDQTVVLVDGIKMGSSTSGLVSWQNLPVELIDRIEIVRGPRSALYGADAIGGVIQIFTRRDEADGWTPRAHAGGGSHGAHEFGTGLGGRSGQAWFGADYSFQRTEGFNSCEVAEFAGCFITEPEPDLDGYIQHALSLRGGYDFSDAWKLALHAMRSEGENEFDGGYSDYSETLQQVVGATLAWQAGERTRLALTAGRNVDASDQFKDGLATGWFSTHRDSATLQADLELATGQTLTLGADWLRDEVESDTAYERDRRSNRAAFAQYQGVFGAHSLQASVRHDDNDQFGEHGTGGIAWGWELGAGFRLNEGWASAFKAPTFNELYYPFFGNPGLAPEESETIELGVAWRGATWDLRLDAFETRVDDLIAYDAALGLPNNIEQARMRGAELSAHGELAGWFVDASLGWLDTENRSGFNSGNALPRRAGENARIDLDRGFGRLRLGLTGIAEGSRWDDVGNSIRLPGYATLDLRAEYELTASLTLQARLANVFDRDHETAAFYNEPGREWMLTLRWAP